ncbi:hypothetical protein [Sphingobacterium hotanense]|uniref:hypothetical protein n=1 Tax=Sphingobacterium hotanense TaxID=649196 RepID=UPI0021A6CA8A|nr:hypothetical protein [Sphingobacterium hotanense]MCT1526816.1 hypothetical protein [Sphingobacterium hotanense]
MTIGVNQIVSPIKFCFLIEPNSEIKFERAVKIAFSYWGGIFSPILPFHSVLPKEFRNEYGIEYDALNYYKNTIDNFDPDIILYDNSLDEEFIKTIIEDRTLLTIEEFISDTEKGKIRYGISILELISNIIETEFKFVRNDNIKLSLPDTQNSGLFLKSFIGCFTDGFQAKIINELKSSSFFEKPEITFNNIADYFPSQNIDTLKINMEEIKVYPERHWFRGEGIYFLNEERLNDIINYWNLRALGWNIIPIPNSQIDNMYFSDFIERYCKFQLNKSENLSIINYQVSATVTEEQKKKIDLKFQEIGKKLGDKLNFGFQGWFPRFWEANRSVLEADRVLCGKIEVNSTYSQVEVQENYVKFKTDNLPFKFKYNFNLIASHKVNLSFNYFDEYLNDAGLIYGIETIDWIRLTHSYGRDKWRLSKTGLNHYVRRDDNEVNFFIPKANDFFKVFFSKSGNKLSETSNGRLANEVLKNIGGIRGSYFLQNKSSLNILDLIEDGKTVYHPQLVGEVKKSLKTNNNEQTNSYIKKIIENKIIEFGSILQCEVCHQHAFYLPSDLKETMTCAICRNNFSLPMHQPNQIKWAYRGIGPFSKNNKVGGVITVFLTLKLFNEEFAETSGNMSALIGFELIKNNKTKEVDLAVMLKEKNKDNVPPDLIFCECKTYKNFTSEDAERMIELGTEFPNSILTFATLNDELTENEKVEILRVVNNFRTGYAQRPTNPVLILTAKELLPKDFWGHFDEYENDSKPYHRHNDWIGNLCEFTVKKHLNVNTWSEVQSELWQAEMQKRNEAVHDKQHPE